MVEIVWIFLRDIVFAIAIRLEGVPYINFETLRIANTFIWVSFRAGITVLKMSNQW